MYLLFFLSASVKAAPKEAVTPCNKHPALLSIYIGVLLCQSPIASTVLS